MGRDLVGENIHRAANEACGAIRVVTRTPTLDLTQPAADPIGCLRAAVAPGELHDGVCDRGEPVSAGPALASALSGEVAARAGGLEESTGARRKSNDRTGAE